MIETEKNAENRMFWGVTCPLKKQTECKIVFYYYYYEKQETLRQTNIITLKQTLKNSYLFIFCQLLRRKSKVVT